MLFRSSVQSDCAFMVSMKDPLLNLCRWGLESVDIQHCASMSRMGISSGRRYARTSQAVSLGRSLRFVSSRKYLSPADVLIVGVASSSLAWSTVYIPVVNYEWYRLSE